MTQGNQTVNCNPSKEEFKVNVKRRTLMSANEQKHPINSMSLDQEISSASNYLYVRNSSENVSYGSIDQGDENQFINSKRLIYGLILCR